MQQSCQKTIAPIISKHPFCLTLCLRGTLWTKAERIHGTAVFQTKYLSFGEKESPVARKRVLKKIYFSITHARNLPC